jgi:hypothetical protein
MPFFQVLSISHQTFKVFDQNQAGEPGDRSLSLVQALAFEANSRGALPMAPREIHEQAARVRRIVTPWAEDFKRDTGHSTPTHMMGALPLF